MTHSSGRQESALFKFLCHAPDLLEQARFEEIWTSGQALLEHNSESHYILGQAAAGLGQHNEAGAHYRFALQKSNDSRLREKIFRAAAVVLPVGQAVVALSQALELTSPEGKGGLLEWKAELEIQSNDWSRAAKSLTEASRLDPGNVGIREFLEEVLIREGRQGEALSILQEATNLSSVELYRRSWLLSPKQRAKPLEPVAPVLHALYGTKAITEVTIECIGPISEQLKSELATFHAREFSDHQLTFQCASRLPPSESFEQLRDLIDVGAKPSWASPDFLQFVAATPRANTPYSGGIGMPGMMVLSFTPKDPFQATVAAHELYHSLLDLNHTNGTEGPDDPGSIMGPWGTRTPLDVTYISEFHRKCCTTTEEVQALVDAQEWEEALVRDPNYLALYRKAANSHLSQGNPDKAVEFLKGWVKVDPGPEAMAQLGELLIQLGRDPVMIFRSCRGFGISANTHLYLAQCYLNCHSFQGALEQLQQAQNLDPENLHVGGMLGWALHGLGRLAEAEAQYQKALERCPGWESVVGRLHWIRGQEYTAPTDDEELLWLEALTTNNPEAILAKLEEPKTAKLLLQQGTHFYKNGQERDAQEAMKKVIELNQYSMESKAAESWLLFLQGREQEAQNKAQSVLEHWPGEPASKYLHSVLTRSS